MEETPGRSRLETPGTTSTSLPMGAQGWQRAPPLSDLAFEVPSSNGGLHVDWLQAILLPLLFIAFDFKFRHEELVVWSSSRIKAD